MHLGYPFGRFPGVRPAKRKVRFPPIADALKAIASNDRFRPIAAIAHLPHLRDCGHRDSGAFGDMMLSNLRGKLLPYGPKIRIAKGMVAVALVSSCSQPQINIEPCLLGKSLAFHIPDAPRYFTKITPKVSSVRVQESWGDPAWQAQIPADNSDPTIEARPATRIILYGQAMPGWEVTLKPRALKVGRRYIIIFGSDAGEGLMDMIAGAPLSPCPTAG
jgi:hypothetical protein